MFCRSVVSLLMVSLIFFSPNTQAQINKIEHFYASSPQAENLFHFFSKELSLPVVWNYQSRNDFSSGGVTLGNVVFELLNRRGIQETWFKGIAFEPRQDIQTVIHDFERNGIEHDTIRKNSSVNKDGKLGGWDLLTLFPSILKESNLFVCDYKDRQLVATGRKNAANTLKQRNGGPLGIVSMKEIVIGSTDYKKTKKELSKLPGIKRKSGGLFIFSEGPAIRLRHGEKNGNEKIVITVRSLADAKHFLQSKDWLGEETRNSIFISPQVIEGLKIELVEK